MTPRGTETVLARGTLGALAVYLPATVWTSWPNELTTPSVLIDLVGIALMLWGATRSLRARPDAAPGVLGAGIAWSASNAWRATAGRVEVLQRGDLVDGGAGIIWLNAASTVVALIGLAVALLLVVESRAGRAG